MSFEVAAIVVSFLLAESNALIGNFLRVVPLNTSLHHGIPIVSSAKTSSNCVAVVGNGIVPSVRFPL